MSQSTSQREEQVMAKPLPGHVGVIMDGNGRWAQTKGWPRIEGHREGSKSVQEITRCSRRIGIKALTLYAFSSQNWTRPPTEVAGLMELLRTYLVKERSEILDNGIRLNAVGELARLPALVRDPLEELRAASAKNTQMVLTLALSYGGREELVSAAKRLAMKVESGKLKASEIVEQHLAAELWTADLPVVDLVIRTSGEHRISNFLLWQSAYAEFVFADAMFPDFRVSQLLDCLEAYQRRDRRFGQVSTARRTP